MQLRQLIHVCIDLAPESLAEEWDNAGLQTGHLDMEIGDILLCLDVAEPVLAEASALGVQCLIAHHPLIFHPLRSAREDTPEGRLLADTIRSRLACYVMHTNLDKTCPGTSDALAEKLGVTDPRPLVSLERPAGERRFKLAVFVPVADAERVRAAMGDAGAGFIGSYSHCSFSTPGVGSFRPMEGAHPAIGAVGAQERVAEEKIEVAAAASVLPRVIEAMLGAHPYEEVVYDVYPLEPPPSRAGLGRIGRLTAPCSLSALAERVRERLPVSVVSVAGDGERMVERVAVCGGSGGDLVDAAASAGAEALVTGDVKHHQALRAGLRSLAILDAGHYATERPVLDWLASALRNRLPNEVRIHISAVNTDPFREGGHA